MPIGLNDSIQGKRKKGILGFTEAATNVEVAIQEWIETAQILDRHIHNPKGRLMYA